MSQKTFPEYILPEQSQFVEFYRFVLFFENDVAIGKGVLLQANRSGSICSIGSDASGLVMETPTKRDNRASIRLTFHSRPSTPLNQSLEEDQDGCTCTETGCKDIPFSCKSVSGCAATDGTLSSSFGQSITENDGKNVTEPSLAHASPTKPRSSSHGPIPLSAVLKANTDLSSSDSPQPKRSFTQTAIAGKSSKKGPNGTWPRRLKDAGSRTAIPVQWRTTPRDILISTSDAQRVANHQVEQVKAAKTRRTRDTYSVGFKSEAIPGLLKGTHLAPGKLLILVQSLCHKHEIVLVVPLVCFSKYNFYNYG